jgi:hypothetical protein
MRYEQSFQVSDLSRARGLMKDGTPTILYIKETRVILYPALCPQSIQSSSAIEQQSTLQVT